MPSNSVHLDEHLTRTLGTSGYSFTNATVNLVSATMTEAQLHALLDVANVAGYKAVLTGGLIQLKPR